MRGRASRVLQLLGISESVPESRAAAGGKVATAAAPDLLGGLLDEPEPAEQAVIPSSDGDMLGKGNSFSSTVTSMCCSLRCKIKNTMGSQQ